MDKKPHKFLVACALILSNLTTYFSDSMVVPMLTTISRDMHVDVSVSGMLSIITLLSTGIALLSSNLLQRVMKPKWIVAAGLLLSVLCNFAIGFATSFVLLLLCRALIGFAIGLLSFSTISLITSWLSGSECGYFLAVHAGSTTLGSYLASRVAVPMMELLAHGWHGSFRLMALVNLVSLAVWLCVGLRDAPRQILDVSRAVQPRQKTFLEMLRRRDVLLLSGMLALISCAHIAVSTYLAAYLELVRGFAVAKAATYLGYLSLSALFGGPVASLISTALGRRKPVLSLGILLSAGSMLFVLLLQSEWLLVAGVLLYGFFSAIYNPITKIIATEMPDTTPEMASTAFSVIYASGYLATIFTPTIMTAVMHTLTMQAAMYVFVGIYFAAFLVSLLVQETGSKRK